MMTTSAATRLDQGAVANASGAGSGRRVGFVSFTDPANANKMASMPHRMARTLEPRVGELITFSPEGGSGLSRQPRPLARRRYIGRVVRHVQWRFLTFDGSIRGLEHYYPRHTYRRTLKQATALSRWLSEEIARHELDALFGCIVTWPLYQLTAPLPRVFYTDATTSVVNATYPGFDDRCWGFKRACEAIEDAVYASAAAVALPADRMLDSAVKDHALSPERGHVVPMGANVVPEAPLASTAGLSRPGKDDLRLCIVASNPARKRTDFAVEVAEILHQRGWGAHLTVIGPVTDRAAASSRVTCVGLLRQSSEADYRRHQGVLSESHVMLLPSLGEGAAIAPAEAAHFGRPSVVSDVAGLPTVVRDGETGRVLPLAAEPGDYADAVEALVSDGERYRAVSEAALSRAQRVLSWDAWGDRMVALLREAVEADARP